MKKFITIAMVVLMAATSVFAAKSSDFIKVKIDDKVALEDFTFTADAAYTNLLAQAGVGTRWALATIDLDFGEFKLPGTADLVAGIDATTDFQSYVFVDGKLGAGYTADISDKVYTTMDFDFVFGAEVLGGTIELGYEGNIGFGYQVSKTFGVTVHGGFGEMFIAGGYQFRWDAGAGVAFNF